MARSRSLFARPGMGVRVEHLSKEYRLAAMTYVVLRDLDLDVRPQEAVAIQGPSGCGKTTLLNLIGGIDRPDSGEMQLGDTLLNGMGERDLERYRLHDVGFIFQMFNLIPGLTALENLELPMVVSGKTREAARERGRALLDMVGMGDNADKRPDELSGGEQQRVAIVIALVNDPFLVLADEPTANLDSRNAEIVADLLASLGREHGKTVIVATHDDLVASRMDRILRMHDGALSTARNAPSEAPIPGG